MESTTGQQPSSSRFSEVSQRAMRGLREGMQELQPRSVGESKEIYKVEQVFHVADFDLERVAKILCKRRKRDTPLGACARFVRRSLDHLQIRASVKHFGASTFILAYYLVQLAYQFDVPLFCATSLRPDHVQ